MLRNSGKISPSKILEPKINKKKKKIIEPKIPLKKNSEARKFQKFGKNFTRKNPTPRNSSKKNQEPKIRPKKLGSPKIMKNLWKIPGKILERKIHPKKIRIKIPPGKILEPKIHKKKF